MSIILTSGYVFTALLSAIGIWYISVIGYYAALGALR